jgi:hypothetical protein
MDVSFISHRSDTATDALQAAPSLTVVLLAMAIAAATGAITAVAIIDGKREEADDLTMLASVNVSIAFLVALLGRLINVKRDQIVPGSEDALRAAALLEKDGDDTITLELEPWVEADYRLRLPDHEVFARAGRQLDVVQLLTLLDLSLADLCHLIRQRNALIAEMTVQGQYDDTYRSDSLRSYIGVTRDIARLTDENLFFIDKSIQKLRMLAQKSLPKKLHARIADVGLRPETGPLMPPTDLIKTFE